MPSKKSLKRSLRAYRPPSHLAVWRKVLRIALLSNAFDQTTELRVLLYLELDMYPELFEMADAMSQTVYETPMLHYRMHQLAALIRKYPLDPSLTGYRPEVTAYTKFLAAEHRCKWVNRRFRAQRTNNRDRMAAITHHARAWIRYVLRDEPDLKAIYKGCDFTPGSALGVHGNATNLARKVLSKVVTVSPGALPYALGSMWSNAHIREAVLHTEGRPIVSLDKDIFREKILSRVRLTSYNKISFVPKTAKTYRSIAVEPLLNSFVQKGIDEFMRQRLKRVGLDLSNQHQNTVLAREGSLDQGDAYCTIDLSSASDTIAHEVVRELLPENWFQLLNEVRSHSYEYRGKKFPYEKFSSMGNGFCFPLETLIFASLCHAVYVESSEHPDFRVYGDDIIVRRGVFQRVIEVLRHFGFQPNPRKTFSTGPFRESCGKDWHNGVNVRPIFITKVLNTMDSLMNLHNESRRREPYVQAFFTEINEYLFSLVPYECRFCSPYDPHPERLFCDWDEAPPDGTFWVPFDVFMGSTGAEWNKRTWSWSFYRLVSRARVDYFDTFVTHTDGVGPVWSGNPAIGMMGALRKQQVFTLRFSAETKLVQYNAPVDTH